MRKKGKNTYVPSTLLDEIFQVKQMKPGISNADAMKIIAFNSQTIRTNSPELGNFLEKLDSSILKKNKKKKDQYNFMSLRF